MYGSETLVSFKYDPLGRRIYKSSSSGTSIYVYDGFNLVEETNTSGTAVARYSQGLNVDEPLAMLRSSTTSYYQNDGLNSITSLSSTAGALAQTYTFDSFGKQTGSSGSVVNSFQYASRELDSESTLYYMRARYFDPATGRFLSEDPSGFEAGPNFYSYVANSPLNYTDLFGLSPNDLQQLLNAARNAVNDMNLNGQRIPNGNLNNILSTLQRLNPFRKKPPLKGCGEQTDNVINKLTPIILHTDNVWTPDKQYEYLTPDHILPHQWVNYTSNDPNDPTLALDPWNNRFQIIPPGGSLNNGGWQPLVPGVH